MTPNNALLERLMRQFFFWCIIQSKQPLTYAQPIVRMSVVDTNNKSEKEPFFQTEELM